MSQIKKFGSREIPGLPEGKLVMGEGEGSEEKKLAGAGATAGRQASTSGQWAALFSSSTATCSSGSSGSRGHCTSWLEAVVILAGLVAG